MSDRFYTSANALRGQVAEESTNNPNVQRVSSMFTNMNDAYGSAVTLGREVEAVAQPMMREYDPRRRKRDSPDRPLCAAENAKGEPCKAYPIKEHPYCTGHARKLGLIEKWSKSDVVDDAD